MQKSNLDRLTTVRRNITTVLRYSSAVPFNWNTKGFFCFYCSKSTRDYRVLKKHILKHASIDLKNYISKHIISKDVPVKVDITNLSCKVCNMLFSSLEDIIKHITEIHDEKFDHSAGVCFFPFRLSKDVIHCVLCEDSYDNVASMVSHMYKNHISHSFICQLCGLSFKDNVRLKRHITTSHMGYRCTICKKIFTALHKLDKHKQRFHGKVKLYDCDLCSEKFRNSYQVKVHMGKVHNVEKYLIKCEHCSKVCTTKGTMMAHVRSVHSKVRYQCDLCDYTSGVKWSIKLHQRKHFGLKEYSCSICERLFGRASNLRTHMKVHTGSVGRVCRICRKGFTNLKSLEKHDLEVHYHDNL